MTTGATLIRFASIGVLGVVLASGLLPAAALQDVGAATSSPPRITTEVGEPNDNFDTAINISPPFQAENQEISLADEDFYAVNLERGERVQVDLMFNHTRGDVDVLLYDPNRDLLRTATSTTDDENVSYQAGLSGTYYIRVIGWSEDTTYYSIRVRRTDAPVPDNDDLEYNDGFSSAAEIPSDFHRDNLVLAPGEFDIYALDLESGMRLNVTVVFDHDVSKIDLRVYNSSQDLIEVGFSASDNESVSLSLDSGGIYYVEVYSRDGNPATYDLRVTPVTRETSTSTPATDTTDGPGTSPPDPTDTTGTSGPGFDVFAALIALLATIAGIHYMSRP